VEIEQKNYYQLHEDGLYTIVNINKSTCSCRHSGQANGSYSVEVSDPSLHFEKIQFSGTYNQLCDNINLAHK
jgi:hypothetical protein